MANTLGNFNPVFYAQEALIQLEKQLGLAGRVHRGYENERRAYGRGETINVRRPSTFSAADAASTAADLATSSLTVTLDNWREVKFKVSDKELAFTGDQIIQEHIRPAAYALADDIDQKLMALATQAGFQFAASTGASAGETLIDARQALLDGTCPVSDTANMHAQISPSLDAAMLKDTSYSNWQGAGAAGVSTQQSGDIGQKFGFNVYTNQNTASYTGSNLTDGAGLVNGAHAAGSTSIAITGVDSSGVIKAGDTVGFAGHPAGYAVSADVTASGGAATIVLTTPLHASVAGSEVVTITGSGGAAKTLSLAFHSNWATLCMAPLPEVPNELGANVATVSDPRTGLSLRSRMYYVGNSSEVHVALDCLFGCKLLDSSLCARINS